MGIGLACGLALAAVWGWETNAVHKDWARVEAVRERGSWWW
jgi:hypothetical protein